MKISVYTLGCKLNYSESSTLARAFDEAGYGRAARGEAAGICIVNTCSVTEHADKKCRNLIRKVVRENPGAIVAVTGCYAQLRPHDIAAIEGVDLVLGNHEKGGLFAEVQAIATSRVESPAATPELPEGSQPGNQSPAPLSPVVHTCEVQQITGFFAAFSDEANRTRAFLKVQDGCDYWCTYCTIPRARGKSRNLPVADLAAQARKIAARGTREIVLTGINVGDFGHTTGESFLDLLRELDQVEGIERYRISSIEPNLLTDEILAFCAASPKFMPHFHIPLQGGSDRVLASMGRRYDTVAFAERIEAVRRVIPDTFIGIDVIAGFPGESDEDFAQTVALLERLQPAFLHIFPYSERPGTRAIGFEGKVSPQEKARRVAVLGSLSDRLHAAFHARFAGTERPVLFESSMKGGKMFGFTDNYLRVEAPYDRALINRIVRTTI